MSSSYGSAAPLDELLLGMRLSSLQFCRIAIRPDAGIGFTNPPGRAQFHFIARGPAWLHGPDGAVHPLHGGDAVLIPRGGRHSMLASADADLEQIIAFDPALRNATRETDNSDGVLVFSGCMQLDLGSMQMLIAAMPDTMLASTLQQAAPEVRPMLDAMEREAKAGKAGQAGIMARLAEVVAALIVRGWAASECGNAGGWVAALLDPRLSAALAAMHTEPGRRWTVAGLAKEARSSRTVFARRFQQSTGLTPLRYLTALRMQLAIRRLVSSGDAVETVAEELGYGSLAAFSRAFKRTVGVSPGTRRIVQAAAFTETGFIIDPKRT
jgi:AraC-like DNA-binding protein/mannose-6-phosphate isomerase-like protein (cupin superfamily)